jgi:hypothetical protein
MCILVILTIQTHNVPMACGVTYTFPHFGKCGISQQPKGNSQINLGFPIEDQSCTRLSTIIPHFLASAPSYPFISLSTWLLVPNCGHISPSYWVTRRLHLFPWWYLSLTRPSPLLLLLREIPLVNGTMLVFPDVMRRPAPGLVILRRPWYVIRFNTGCGRDGHNDLESLI